VSNKQQEFRYDIDRIRSRYSKAEILASLKEYGRLHPGSPFGMREYDSWPGRLVTSETIRLRFRSWGRALQSAGFRVQRSNKLDSREMVTAFRDCWREHGSVPSQRNLSQYLERHNYPFRTKSYYAFFGGLGRLARLIHEVDLGQLPEPELHRRHKPPPDRRRAVPLRVRMDVLKRDDYRCTKCGASPRDDKSVRLEVDHVIPVSRGGSSTMDNLRTLCFSCNQGKKDRDD
jgi:hypothetical protein